MEFSIEFEPYSSWGGSGSLQDGSGDIDDGSVSATLRVDDCIVSFRKEFYSSIAGTGSASENCSHDGSWRLSRRPTPGAVDRTGLIAPRFAP